MIKDMFSDYNFTFKEWIKLFQYNEWLIKVFRSEYEYMSINIKKQLILNHALK